MKNRTDNACVVSSHALSLHMRCLFRSKFNILSMKKLSMDELNRVTTEEFKKQQKIPLVVVMDNVRSMYM